MSQQIELYKGTTLIQDINITSNGESYILTSGEKIKFGVKEDSNHTRYLIEREWTSENQNSDGTITLKLKPDDTINLPAKIYKYDIGLQKGDDYYIIVPESNLVVKNSITKWG